MTHILVTNDDGISAPGLLELSLSLQVLGKVTVLAPDHNWSSSGHVKTLNRPLRIKKVSLIENIDAFSCDGAPSDCVALALLGFIKEPIDLVVSGINPSINVGSDLTYSGTVTAVMEALIFGKPGISVSIDGKSGAEIVQNYPTAGHFARQIVSTALAEGIPKGLLLNINVPDLPLHSIRGIQVTRQGRRVYRDVLDERVDPMGQPYYWIGGDVPTGHPDAGTDLGALAQDFVSVTPIHLDLTAHQYIEQIRSWHWS